MARQETYGNWLGPPAPPKRLVRQAGIYSVAGKTPPGGDFRPASPDSFEADYDDVSFSGSEGGGEGGATSPRPPLAPPPPRGDKSTAGVYILAGKPASPKPSQKGEEAPGAGRGGCRGPGVAPLYVLVALSAVAWVLLLALGLRKQMEILEELKLLRSNYSENEENVRRELGETRRQLTRLRSGMHQYYQEMQDMAGLICESVTDKRKCSSGWKSLGKSCYFFSAETAPWAEARETCADLGAHLLIIDSEPEQSFLMDNIQTGPYWLGATDELVEGTWVWTNGQQVNFSYWNTWKKDKEREEKDCGIIGTGGIWSDAHCSHPNRWICEKSWNC